MVELMAEEPKNVASTKRVLIVDDNEDSAYMLSAMLRMNGYDVVMAHDASEALTVVDRGAVDIAVIDIGLPVMDGNELAKLLRANVRTTKCKLVALTGHGGAADIARTTSSGFDEHLVKPVDMAHLLRVLADNAVC